MLPGAILLEGVAFVVSPIGSCSPFRTRTTPQQNNLRTRKGYSHVANIKSQKKRILTNAKRAERNKAVKSELRTRVKTATKTIGTDDNTESVRLAVKRLDMAAAKGIIHPNQAARRKSRLMKQVNATS